MKFCYIKYVGLAPKYIHALVLGEYEGKYIVLDSEKITQREANIIRINLESLKKSHLKDIVHFMKITIMNFSGAYKEIKIQNIIKIKEHELTEFKT